MPKKSEAPRTERFLQYLATKIDGALIQIGERPIMIRETARDRHEAVFQVLVEIPGVKTLRGSPLKPDKATGRSLHEIARVLVRDAGNVTGSYSRHSYDIPERVVIQPPYHYSYGDSKAFRTRTFQVKDSGTMNARIHSATFISKIIGLFESAVETIRRWERLEEEHRVRGDEKKARDARRREAWSDFASRRICQTVFGAWSLHEVEVSQDYIQKKSGHGTLSFDTPFGKIRLEVDPLASTAKIECIEDETGRDSHLLPLEGDHSAEDFVGRLRFIREPSD